MFEEEYMDDTVFNQNEHHHFDNMDNHYHETDRDDNEYDDKHPIVEDEHEECEEDNLDKHPISMSKHEVVHNLPEIDPDKGTNLVERVKDPLGAYSIKNISGHLPENIEHYRTPHLSIDFSQNELNVACDCICDSLHWKHLPVFITESVDNAQFATLGGPFLRWTFDDQLFLNPEYAKDCIERFGSTDVVLTDMAHEIGHSMATKLCGVTGTPFDEKMADFISGFASYKLNLDIDVARQWFDYYYDPQGSRDYPNSDERWDATAAGYYFAHWANGDDLQEALKDKHFQAIVNAYTTERKELLAQMEWQHQDEHKRLESIKGYSQHFIDSVKQHPSRYLPAILAAIKHI